MNDELLRLGPPTLPNFRKRRYLGDDLCLPLSDFTPADQERVRALYVFLEQAFPIFEAKTDISPERVAQVAKFVGQQDVKTLFRSMQAFGLESQEANPSELMVKTIHDLRGGGLSFLLNTLQFVQMGRVTAETVRTLFFLTRDHLKIMRNALLGLDDAKREEDLQPKLHGISYIVEKWKDAVLRGQEREVRLEVESKFEGNISECCVEFGALDRILYNLINNACRHTSANIVSLYIMPWPDSDSQDLQFIVANRITAIERAALKDRDLNELFRPGASSTGSGFGMTIAADFVANAYGLGSHNKALAGQYLGARLINEEFAAWFHWPIAPDI